MDLFYLQKSKEELETAYELFKNFNNITILKLIDHLTKGMAFLVDFLNSKHVDLDLDLSMYRQVIERIVGKDFIETYFYLKSLKTKPIRVLNQSNILVQGKIIDHVNKEHFKQLLVKVSDYFNVIYDRTENGLV